jgi:glycosyltransferase involved in cell wall biosynthesis
MPRVLGVGNLVPCNGFDAAIRALPFIPDAEFVIVSTSDCNEHEAEASRLRSLARQWGVAGRLRLHRLAAAAELPELLRSADVVACTPTEEVSGVVALQAMACGIPVVAADVGALHDIVIHEVTGRLVDRRDPKVVAASVGSLLRDSFLRRSLGGAGRDRVVASYTWDRVAGNAVRLYHESVAARCGELSTMPA